MSSTDPQALEQAKPYGWEVQGRVYFDEATAKQAAWLTSTTAGASLPVTTLYTHPSDALAAIKAARVQVLEEAVAACASRKGTASMFITSRDAMNHNTVVNECIEAIRLLGEDAGRGES